MLFPVPRAIPGAIHHDIRDVLVRLLESGMVFVQLVSEDESQRFLLLMHLSTHLSCFREGFHYQPLYANLAPKAIYVIDSYIHGGAHD